MKKLSVGDRVLIGGGKEPHAVAEIIRRGINGSLLFYKLCDEAGVLKHGGPLGYCRGELNKLSE